MLKKIAVSLAIVMAAAVFSGTALAQEEVAEEPQATGEAEYKLPFPGMLPDHFLYNLKTARDKLVLFLIRDPYKEAEKHLELADRMLFESLKLAEKDEGKMDLAVHNAFKGEDHMTQLVSSFKDAVYSGKDFDRTLAERAHQAAGAHRNLLLGIKDRAGSKNSQKIETIMEFSQRNDQELFKLEQEATAAPELQNDILPPELE